MVADLQAQVAELRQKLDEATADTIVLSPETVKLSPVVANVSPRQPAPPDPPPRKKFTEALDEECDAPKDERPEQRAQEEAARKEAGAAAAAAAKCTQEEEAAAAAALSTAPPPKPAQLAYPVASEAELPPTNGTAPTRAAGLGRRQSAPAFLEKAVAWKRPKSLFEFAAAQRGTAYEEGSDGPCPPVVQAAAEALQAALAERHTNTTPWGKPAKVQGPIIVHARATPTTRALEFRTTLTFRGVRADDIFEAFLYEHRVAWDPNFSSVAYLRRYERTAVAEPADALADERWVDVCAYTTKPAAGGMISGRAFVDLRHTRRLVTTVPPKEGSGECVELVEYVSSSAGGQWSDPSALPPCLADEVDGALGMRTYLELVREAKLQMAYNQVGGGLTVRERLDEATGEVLVDMHSLSCSEIGGRVPVSIVNSATAGAMCAVYEGLGKQLKEQFPGSGMVGGK